MNAKRNSIIKIFNRSIILNLSILFLLSLFVISTVLIVRRHQQTYMKEVYEKQLLKGIMVKIEALEASIDSEDDLRTGLEEFYGHYKRYYDKVSKDDDTEKHNRIKMTMDIEVFLLVSDLKKIIDSENGISPNVEDDLYAKRFVNRKEKINKHVQSEIRILEKIIPGKHYRLTQIQNLSIVIFISLLILTSLFILINRTFLLKNITEPLTKLREAMKRIGHGDFDYKIDEYHNNELGDLCNTMNSLTENILKSHKQLTESHRMASIGVMASGIAHELSQPLGVILLKSQLLSVLLEKKDYSKAEKESKSIEVQILRAKKIIDSLRIISREGKEEEKTLVDVNELIDEVITLYDDEFRYNGIILKKDLSNLKLSVFASHVQVCQAISNIISNARDAVKNIKDSEICVKSHKDDNEVVISISDNGIGISQRHIKRIFEPFYTLKDVKEGTGLGLSLCQSMVKENNGEVTVSSEEGKGSLFELRFPFADGVTYE